MKLTLSDLPIRTLHLFIFVTIFELSVNAPQRYNSYPYYYPYYPNRRSGYSQKSQVTRPAAQALKRQIASNGVTYSPNLLADASVTLKTQNDQNKISKNRVSKADVENAKFAGAQNQEVEEESQRTARLLHRNRFRRPLASPCFRDASGGATTASGKKATDDPKEQGRFLFDLNVYNVYPPGGVGCGGVGLGGGFGGGFGSGFGGGLLGGGGLLSDALADAIAPQPTPLENLLTLFAPGILQNSLAATARPRPQIPLQADTPDTDPAVDPAYNPRPVPPVRRPNRVYYDSAGATPITPAQLIGGVATTVNGIIQQLTGNVQPVYPAYRRAFSYG